MSSITIGIDIAKQKFDVYLQSSEGSNTHRIFSNDTEGFDGLRALIPAGSEVKIGVEATGIYGDNLVRTLHHAGIAVYVINPAQLKYYAKGMMVRAKTDKVDAKLICDFLHKNHEKLFLWHPKSDASEKLQAYHRCMQSLKWDQNRLCGRMEACKHTDTIAKKLSLTSYQKQYDFLEEEAQSFLLQSLEVVHACKDLSQQFDLLLTIPGIGEETALALLGELPDLTLFSHAKQLAAYAGLNPVIRESGTSVRGKGRISRAGSANLRRLLYFPAITALQHNPIIKAFGDRLKAKGKNGKVIVIAAMRKLLHMIYGILKSGRAFAEHYGLEVVPALSIQAVVTSNKKIASRSNIGRALAKRERAAKKGLSKTVEGAKELGLNGARLVQRRKKAA